MTKPTFICIGVQKGGTSSLKIHFKKHPEIFMHDKELHFFDRDLNKCEITNNDIIKYENKFETDKKIIGVKTPSYCYLPYALDRIYNYDKNIKLILILREPVSRLLSHINMSMQRGSIMKNFTEDEILIYIKECEKVNLTNNKENYLVRGYYDQILNNLFSKFKKKNIYIGISEKIRNNKFKYYNEMFKFIGANKLEKIDENLETHVRKYDREFSNKFKKQLYDIYKPYILRTYEILGGPIQEWEEIYKKLE